MAYSDNALESQLRRLLVDSSSSATSIDHLKEKYDIPKNG
jgi:Ran GTPase-activating protein (RanGAP) involved in mRNA processing and transport